MKTCTYKYLVGSRRGLAWLAAALVIATGIAGLQTAFGEVISGTQITFGTYPGDPEVANYEATVQQGPVNSDPGNDTEVGFLFTGTTLRATFSAADEGSDWYLASAGDVFSAATLAANEFPAIIVWDRAQGPVPIPVGTFYLGVNTGRALTSGAPDRDVFGWLELDNTGTELIPVANAVDYGDGGIIVGTTTPAPEPASLLVLAGGVGLLAIRRRGRL